MIQVVKSVFHVIKLIRKVRRCDYLICNGPGISVIVGIIFKIFLRPKIVYVESIARYNRLSLTGRIMEYFSDYFIVQSKPLLKKGRVLYNFLFHEEQEEGDKQDLG
jgi:hypothetical protein